MRAPLSMPIPYEILAKHVNTTWRERLDRLTTTAPLAPLLRPLQQGVSAIFMLHRFADAELGVAGHDPQLVSRCLAYLRDRGFRVRPALELIDAARRGENISRCVAFTVDDGYVDFHSVGRFLFAEFDAPVTVFVPTGVVDRHSWFWWDRVAEALRIAPCVSVPFDVNGRTLTLRLSDAPGRQAATVELTAAMKQLPPAELIIAIDRLTTALNVELPLHPPRRLSTMEWDAIRECAAGGVQFGPHTEAHVILSRLRLDEAKHEVAASWRRLRDEAPDAAVPLFCYPNGQRGDFSSDLFDVLADEGMAAAVTAVTGYLRRGGNGTAFEKYAVPRFAFPDSFIEFKSFVLGVERFAAAANVMLSRKT